MAYVLVVGENNQAPEGISEEDSIAQCLHWIGFRTEQQRESIIEDAFTSWFMIEQLKTSDVVSMAKSFAARTPANRKIVFGTNRTKLLKSFMFWVQDYYRISEEPTIEGVDQPGFIKQLVTAQKHDNARENLKEQTVSAAKAANPGPLIKETEWKEWEEKFINYTRAHIGVAGVPLSYVIRKKEDPMDNDVPDDQDFVTKTILRAPLSGDAYETDYSTSLYPSQRDIHQVIG